MGWWYDYEEVPEDTSTSPIVRNVNIGGRLSAAASIPVLTDLALRALESQNASPAAAVVDADAVGEHKSQAFHIAAIRRDHFNRTGAMELTSEQCPSICVTTPVSHAPT